MTDIYAACLSVSQSVDRPRATAHVLHTEDGRRTSFTMEWKLPHGINAGGNPGEWLYAILSRLVQDYDMHVVTDASIDGSHMLREVEGE
jgi:hypothetical protein